MTGEGGEAVYIIGPDAFLQREKIQDHLRGERGRPGHARRHRQGAQRLRQEPRQGGSAACQLVTTTATIGIRGTGCYIEAEEARTYFCLCYGEAEVAPKGDPKQKETIQQNSPSAAGLGRQSLLAL
jgi:hypothetical protein